MEVIEPVMQKDGSDCGVACLAMVLGLPYATVRAAVPKRTDLGSVGLSNRQMRAIAKRLGHALVYLPGVPHDRIGVLDLQRQVEGEWEGHFVVWARRVLFNPADGMIWTDLETFCQVRGWEVCGLFVTKESDGTDR